jgi:pimeloyl-ACP methyl ester carboxylesterase
VVPRVLTILQSLPIRQFLLTNLVRSEEDNTLKFRVPLSVIGGSLDNMADFPFKQSDNLQYEGPTLFVRGTKSRYVSEKTLPAIKAFFPNAQIADVEAGHWLISEQPEAFRQGKKPMFPACLLSIPLFAYTGIIAVVKFLEST